MRAQANLPALAVAIVLVTAATVTAVGVADDAIRARDGQPIERHVAAAVADRLVAGDAPTTLRRGVLANETVQSLNASTLTRLAPVLAGRDVRVRLDGETVVERGSPRGGQTVSRVVRVGTSENVTRTLNLSRTSRLTLSARTSRVTLAVQPGPNTSVRTVRVNGRVVRHDPDGVDGLETVTVSRRTPATLSVSVTGNATGYVDVRYAAVGTEDAVLEVTVDA